VEHPDDAVAVEQAAIGNAQGIEKGHDAVIGIGEHREMESVQDFPVPATLDAHPCSDRENRHTLGLIGLPNRFESQSLRLATRSPRCEKTEEDDVSGLIAEIKQLVV